MVQLLGENSVTLRKAAFPFRAINHRLRQQIFSFLAETGAQTVTSIYVQFRLEQTVASQMLAILRKEGLVTTERMGKFIYYSANEKRLEELINVAKQLTGKK